MSLSFWCVFLAFHLNYASKLPVALAMHRLGGYDNRHPRDQQARLEGWGRRALAAHQNGFEMFPAFGLSVVIAQIGGGDAAWVDRLAILFVLSRVAYIACYIGDIHWLRSTVWFVGLIAVSALFLMPLF